MPLPKSPQPRIQIQAVEPIVDCGRAALKRTVGDPVEVYATVVNDGTQSIVVTANWTSGLWRYAEPTSETPARAATGSRKARAQKRPIAARSASAPARMGMPYVE